jgi:hexosaminidase
VRYAAQRNVIVLPEIEMPAHTTAALAAYPQYSCTGGPFQVTTVAIWPITDIFCAGNDSTFEFLQNVLTEVFDLFPNPYIHIGGDEADKTNWRACPKCQARMKQEGLPDENALRILHQADREFVIAKNRRLIGWDEILDGGLAPQAQSCRGVAWRAVSRRPAWGTTSSRRLAHVFNSYQGRPEFEPPAGRIPAAPRVYAFEPVPEDLTADQAAHVLGGQGCLWTEHVPSPENAEYMLLPRLAAIAEVLWSPKNRRDEGFPSAD